VIGLWCGDIYLKSNHFCSFIFVECEIATRWGRRRICIDHGIGAKLLRLSCVNDCKSWKRLLKYTVVLMETNVSLQCNYLFCGGLTTCS
jgi:hypothetical protein